MIDQKADMRRLRRSDLIDIIYELQKEVNALEAKNEQLIKELQHKEIVIENTGSIAEAALVLNGVFEAAQKAAEQYLESIKAANANNEEQTKKIISEAHQKAEVLIEEGKKIYIQLKQKGEKEYHERIAQSEAECNAMRKKIVEIVNSNEISETDRTGIIFGKRKLSAKRRRPGFLELRYFRQ